MLFLRFQKNMSTLCQTFVIKCTMLLSVCFFMAGIAANTCCNGQSLQGCLCEHQHKTQVEVHSPAPPCCSETQECSCCLSSSQRPNIQDFSFLSIRVEHQISGENPSVATNGALSNDHIQKGSRIQLHVEAIARSAPIYIQHLSLLC